VCKKISRQVSEITFDDAQVFHNISVPEEELQDYARVMWGTLPIVRNKKYFTYI
jgi:hypothetical protein